MHHGRFPPSPPAAPPAGSPPAFQRGGWAPADLEPPTDRRRFLYGVAGLVAGGCLGAAGAIGGAAKRQRTVTPPEAADSGADAEIAWAIALVEADDRTVIDAAGELDRLNARRRDDRRLLPVYDRLQRAVLREPEAELADLAGTCLVRSLARAGERGRLRDLVRALRARPRLTRTHEAALEVLER